MHFKTGIYKPIKSKCKYTKYVKYRSSYEHALCLLCDSKDSIVRWEFEQIWITYQYRGTNHKYLVDFAIWLANGKKFLIEVKPFAFYSLVTLDIPAALTVTGSSIIFSTLKKRHFKIIV